MSVCACPRGCICTIHVCVHIPCVRASLYAFVCVHVPTRVHLQHPCIHTCPMSAHISARLRVFTRMCACLCTRVCMSTHTHMSRACAHIYICGHVYTCVPTRVHVHTCMYQRTPHVCTRLHVRVCTCVRACTWSASALCSEDQAPWPAARRCLVKGPGTATGAQGQGPARRWEDAGRVTAAPPRTRPVPPGHAALSEAELVGQRALLRLARSCPPNW